MSDWYYHGTSPASAKLIWTNGFRVGRFLPPGEDEPRWIGYGNIGYGTYVSADWRVALWYGRVLVRSSMRRGTRILEMPSQPDAKILSYLKREFGKDILKTVHLSQVLPRNKRLTLEEHIAVLGYHYREVGRYFWSEGRTLGETKHRRKRLNIRAMHRLGAELRRFGMHGYGEPEGFNGIVMFEPSRLVVDRLIRVDKDLWMELTAAGYDPESLESWEDAGVEAHRLT